jgi:hypothetical protein
MTDTSARIRSTITTKTNVLQDVSQMPVEDHDITINDIHVPSGRSVDV